jgi:hypothetical protein
MNTEEKNHPLHRLQDKKLNSLKLQIGEVKQLRLSGWKGFKLYLQNPLDTQSADPAIKGIYSSGGKDGVQPWMDLDYRDEVEFHDPSGEPEKHILSTSGLGIKLFSYLGDLIPPGGHLMVSYEGEQQIHSDTRKSLGIGIPPAATPLGFLLFKSGFPYIKDWYLAEGGFEGPRKLWGEKAPHKEWERNFHNRTSLQIDKFLGQTFSAKHQDLVEIAQKRSKKIMEIIRKNSKKR